MWNKLLTIAIFCIALLGGCSKNSSEKYIRNILGAN